MKNDVAPVDTKLATVAEAGRSTYNFTAKDYFDVKKSGLKISTVKKFFWFVFALILVSTITPQLMSERNRQELAEEIRAQEKPADNSKMDIPNIKNEDSNSSREKSSPGGGRPLPPANKIKSIDLRVMTEPPPGAEVNAILVSGGANGTVKVKTTQDLVLNDESYAQAGSLLIGTGSSTDKRLYVIFTRLVSPEGKSKKIFAQAFDFKDRIRGLNGKKVSDQVFKIAASSALIFLSGLSESLQDSQATTGLAGQRKSMRDAALGGVAQASSEHGKRMLDDLNNDNQIEVQKETELVVIFDTKEDMNGK